eukprot:10837763-Heterocapsa_arctica.AAC.1
MSTLSSHFCNRFSAVTKSSEFSAKAATTARPPETMVKPINARRRMSNLRALTSSTVCCVLCAMLRNDCPPQSRRSVEAGSTAEMTRGDGNAAVLWTVGCGRSVSFARSSLKFFTSSRAPRVMR